MRILKNFLLLFSLMLTVISCSSDQDVADMPAVVPPSPPPAIHALLFNIHTSAYLNEKADPELAKFDEIDYYITDQNDLLVENTKNIYDPLLCQLKVEGLKDGNYHLFILAAKGNLTADGVTINHIANIKDKWLSFDTKASDQPLQTEFYYTKHRFSVSENKLSDNNVTMSRTVGLVDFQFSYDNEVLRSSVAEIELNQSDGPFTYGSLNFDGTYADTRQKLKPLSLLNKHSLLLLPTVNGGAFSGNVRITFKKNNGELFTENCSFNTTVKPNERSIVNIAVKEVETDKAGIIKVANSSYTAENFYKILSDAEPKYVYYDSEQRSFNVNEPLQVDFNGKQQLHIRFYSAVPIHDVTLLAKINGVSEYFEFAHFDEIPAFADALFSSPITSLSSVYKTESGSNIVIPPHSDLNNSQISFKISTNDPYWQKIREIKAKWYIYFSSFGGNPDAADGGPYGNWMGIRPVHIREAVALLTNMAWFNETVEYREMLIKNQGNYHVNDGTTLKDNTILISQMRNRPNICVGLVWSGKNVLGIGGEEIWGIYQRGFLEHYYDHGQCNTHTAFHEAGHCMGYDHSSSLSSGPWAYDATKVFKEIAEQGRMPVSSSSYLKSYESPYIYP